MSESFVRVLSGHSGCTVKLMANENGLFVRKISAGEEYNERLAAQIRKQKTFSDNTIKTPGVFDEGYTIDGRYYADMDFVCGSTLADSLPNLSEEAVKEIIDKILKRYSVYNGTTIIGDENIRNKLKSLDTTLYQFGKDSVCGKALRFLETQTFVIHPFSCHGDLTLENIIIADDGIYLIDFLDSFCDCIETDLSKLLQDAVCKWSYRGYGYIGRDLERNLDIIKKTVYQKYTAFRANPDMSNERKRTNLRNMLILTLLRIYPYAKDIKTVDFLNAATKLVLSEQGVEL